MSGVLTIIRRAVLCVTIIPMILALQVFGVIVVFPAMIVMDWLMGGVNPLRFALDAVFVDGPWTEICGAWEGGQ